VVAVRATRPRPRCPGARRGCSFLDPGVSSFHLRRDILPDRPATTLRRAGRNQCQLPLSPPNLFFRLVAVQPGKGGKNRSSDVSCPHAGRLVVLSRPAKLGHLMKSKMNNKEKGVNNEMKSQPSDHSVTEKTDPGKEERELKPLDDPAPDAPDMEEIVTFARRYYATGFPNPQRRGCPPPGEIMKVVSRRRAPDQALREHLFECSECFGEYRQALAQLRNEVVGWKRLISSFTLMRVSTSAVILL